MSHIIQTSQTAEGEIVVRKIFWFISVFYDGWFFSDREASPEILKAEAEYYWEDRAKAVFGVLLAIALIGFKAPPTIVFAVAYALGLWSYLAADWWDFEPSPSIMVISFGAFWGAAVWIAARITLTAA